MLIKNRVRRWATKTKTKPAFFSTPSFFPGLIPLSIFLPPPHPEQYRNNGAVIQVHNTTSLPPLPPHTSSLLQHGTSTGCIFLQDISTCSAWAAVLVSALTQPLHELPVENLLCHGCLHKLGGNYALLPGGPLVPSFPSDLGVWGCFSHSSLCPQLLQGGFWPLLKGIFPEAPPVSLWIQLWSAVALLELAVSSTGQSLASSQRSFLQPPATKTLPHKPNTEVNFFNISTYSTLI